MEEALNDSELYKEYFKERGIEKGSIVQYKTKFISDDYTINEVKCKAHTWSMGDRYYKLSYRYYGNYSNWWLIAMFNQKPTEAHVKYGDTIWVPIDPTQLKKRR